MADLRHLVVLSPFGVYPVRSGGHSSVLEPARYLARVGVKVHLFGFGIRRFEAFRHFRSFCRELEPRLVEERLVSPWHWLDYLRRGRTGLPPLRAGAFLKRRASSVLRENCAEADAVVIELPWLFDFAPKDRPRVLVAHNVETTLVDENPKARAWHRETAARLEGAAWQSVDHVICFTEDDRRGLAERYGDRAATVIPIGVNTESRRPATVSERAEARRELRVDDRFVVLFTGAWHLPNRAARDRMIGWAQRMADRFLFVVAGSVGKQRAQGQNWVITGTLASLEPWFRAADCCVNPVIQGSGANVKILEYFANGTPVVTTPFGARGLDARDGEDLLVRELDDFPAALEELASDSENAAAIGAAGQAWVESNRSWVALAARRKALIESLL
jgi:glycosyltransferase involved in cell wall biosynthesis